MYSTNHVAVWTKALRNILKLHVLEFYEFPKIEMRYVSGIYTYYHNNVLFDCVFVRVWVSVCVCELNNCLKLALPILSFDPELYWWNKDIGCWHENSINYNGIHWWMYYWCILLIKKNKCCQSVWLNFVFFPSDSAYSHMFSTSLFQITSTVKSLEFAVAQFS